MSDKDNATKQIFNLAERMTAAIDDAAESLDVFVLLPLTSSRPLLMSIKRNLDKKKRDLTLSKCHDQVHFHRTVSVNHSLHCLYSQCPIPVFSFVSQILLVIQS